MQDSIRGGGGGAVGEGVVGISTIKIVGTGYVSFTVSFLGGGNGSAMPMMSIVPAFMKIFRYTTPGPPKYSSLKIIPFDDHNVQCVVYSRNGAALSSPPEKSI
jgi:hypothetical protein